jgi:hypothetical protein
MKKKILLTHPKLSDNIKNVQSTCPNVIGSTNFEEVYVMVKAGEVEKICIIFDIIGTDPLTAIKKIYTADPTIFVLAWNCPAVGIQDLASFPELLTNRIFYMCHMKVDYLLDTICKFFSGTLTPTEIKRLEALAEL